MYIGWNDRIWRGYDIKRGWTELKGCFATPSEGMDTTCHRNHIHISLTWDGASGRSSFWDGTPMDGPYCAPQKSSATTPAGGRTADAVAVGPVRVLGTRKAVGIEARCRLQQDRWSGDSHRLYAKVTGQGGIPETGVAAVAVQVVAMGSNAASSVRIWSPGQSKSEIVTKVPMNMDASGTAIVPVASDGTIALATSAGATDISVDVTGYYPAGDVPTTSSPPPAPPCPWVRSRRSLLSRLPHRRPRLLRTRRRAPVRRTSPRSLRRSTSSPLWVLTSGMNRRSRARSTPARSAAWACPACPARPRRRWS